MRWLGTTLSLLLVTVMANRRTPSPRVITLVIYLIGTTCVVGAVLAGANAAVAEAQADTDDWTVLDENVTVEFAPGDGQNKTAEISVANLNSSEDVDINASFDGPGSVTETPFGGLDPGETDTVTVAVAPDESGGTLSITGGGVSREIDIEIETPAYLGATGPEWLENGLLPGETRTANISVTEQGGYTGVSGINISESRSVEFPSPRFNRTLSNVAFGGLASVNLGPGETTTVGVNITAPDDAAPGDSVGGTVTLAPQDGYDTFQSESRLSVETFVARPPTLGEINTTIDQIVFDDPKSVGTISRRAEITVTNLGDRAVRLEGLRSEDRNFDIAVQQAPATIPARSGPDDPGRATVLANVSAETTLGEGDRFFNPTVVTSGYQFPYRNGTLAVENQTLFTELTVVHETAIRVASDTLSLGSIKTGSSATASTAVSETLGYQEVPGIEVERLSGQAKFISLTERPESTIEAASQHPVTVEVAFDSTAELGTQYQWRFEVTGTGVRSQNVTVNATPVPLDLTPVDSQLTNATVDRPEIETAITKTSEMINSIQTGAVPRQDILPVFTFGDAVTRAVQRADTATSEIAQDNHDQAQEQLIQAAVSFATVTEYGATIGDDRLRNQATDVRDTIDAELDRLLSEQERHYRELSARGNLTLTEETAIWRELARVAALSGDDERAVRLAAKAETTLETYIRLVTEAEQKRSRAEQLSQTISTELSITVAGRDVVLNPLQYETFTDRVTELTTAYHDAETLLREAGEPARADSIATERSQQLETLAAARWSLYLSTAGLAGIILGVTAYLSRSMFRYIRDSQASTVGDFLFSER